MNIDNKPRKEYYMSYNDISLNDYLECLCLQSLLPISLLLSRPSTSC